MRISLNIKKKHLYFFAIFLLLIIAGISFASTYDNSPSHDTLWTKMIKGKGVNEITVGDNLKFESGKGITLGGIFKNSWSDNVLMSQPVLFGPGDAITHISFKNIDLKQHRSYEITLIGSLVSTDKDNQLCNIVLRPNGVSDSKYYINRVRRLTSSTTSSVVISNPSDGAGILIGSNGQDGIGSYDPEGEKDLSTNFGYIISKFNYGSITAPGYANGNYEYIAGYIGNGLTKDNKYEFTDVSAIWGQDKYTYLASLDIYVIGKGCEFRGDLYINKLS